MYDVPLPLRHSEVSPPTISHSGVGPSLTDGPRLEEESWGNFMLELPGYSDRTFARMSDILGGSEVQKAALLWRFTGE